MAEYIDREAALHALHEIGGCGAPPDTWANGFDKAIDEAYRSIQRLPAADVAPVVHGRWIMHDDEFGLTCECSSCHIETMGDGNYCPNCGARMDGGAADTNRGDNMRCGSCDKTDGLCYTSLPPKVKCTATGEYHLYDDECTVKRQSVVGAYESSYIDLLTQLHDAVQSDECMWSCDKISILNKITQLEQALEKYSG